MALFPLNPGLMPLGQFDCLDSDIASVTGGEVMTFGLVTHGTSTDKAASDATDGYAYDAVATIKNRALAKLATAASSVNFLADDGLAGYGTMFGETIGTYAGLTVTGTNLGPHTAAASGKVTLWDKPGLYEVSTSSLASDFVSVLAGSGTGIAPGTVLGHTNVGKLAHASCTAVAPVASSGVATFVEFSSGGSLVTTPARLVGTTTLSVLYPRIVIAFNAGMMADRTVSAIVAAS